MKYNVLTNNLSISRNIYVEIYDLFVVVEALVASRVPPKGEKNRVSAKEKARATHKTSKQERQNTVYRSIQLV
jgi:hypothetical protein